MSPRSTTWAHFPRDFPPTCRVSFLAPLLTYLLPSFLPSSLLSLSLFLAHTPTSTLLPSCLLSSLAFNNSAPCLLYPLALHLVSFISYLARLTQLTLRGIHSHSLLFAFYYFAFYCFLTYYFFMLFIVLQLSSFFIFLRWGIRPSAFLYAKSQLMECPRAYNL